MTAQSQLEAYLGEFRRRLTSADRRARRGAARGRGTRDHAGRGVLRHPPRVRPRDRLRRRARCCVLRSWAPSWSAARPAAARAQAHAAASAKSNAARPDFDGRLETYDGIAHGPRERARRSCGLLAEDALKLARSIPVALKIPALQLRMPAVLAVRRRRQRSSGSRPSAPTIGATACAICGRAGSLADTLPPQRIAVVPGDGTVRRGGDLTCRAHAEGLRAVAA